MLAPLGAGIDVTIRLRTPTSHDEYGNDVFTVTETTYSGCGFWPGSAGRNVAGSNVYGAADYRNSVVTRAQVLLPDDAVVTPLSEAVVMGATWKVVGEGQQWSSQLTGATGGIEVAIERTDG